MKGSILFMLDCVCGGGFNCSPKIRDLPAPLPSLRSAASKGGCCPRLSLWFTCFSFLPSCSGLCIRQWAREGFSKLQALSQLPVDSRPKGRGLNCAKQIRRICISICPSSSCVSPSLSLFPSLSLTHTHITKPCMGVQCTLSPSPAPPPSPLSSAPYPFSFLSASSCSLSSLQWDSVWGCVCVCVRAEKRERGCSGTGAGVSCSLTTELCCPLKQWPCLCLVGGPRPRLSPFQPWLKADP